MKAPAYNLITPLKNEEENIKELTKCVLNQSHKPKIWMIIDDGSTDNTSDILKKLCAEYNWIHSYKMEEDAERTFGKHFAKVVRTGFEESLKYYSNVKYLAKVDADARFHPNMFKTLINKMEEREEFGIASPRLITLKNKIDIGNLKKPEKIVNDKSLVLKSDKNRFDEPTDVVRIYRKKFLDEINGFPITDASSEIINAKAVMNGYSVGFIDEWGYINREIGTTLESMYTRGKLHGYRFYIEHYHPVLLLARFMWSLFDHPTRFIGELVGYFESFINKKEKMKDPDIIKYYSKERLKKLFKFIAEKN